LVQEHLVCFTRVLARLSPKPTTRKSKSASEDALVWPEDWTEEAKRAKPLRPTPEAVERLNRSQLTAVNRMLSSTSHHITIVQGPPGELCVKVSLLPRFIFLFPGTGKTSVIAQFVIAATRCGKNDIWLVAQRSALAQSHLALWLISYEVTLL
jgi:hypothetical protein